MTNHDASTAADPTEWALNLMRATWPDRTDDPVEERLRLVQDLIDPEQDDTDLLATWLQRALQD